jgi:hypothetical protein
MDFHLSHNLFQNSIKILFIKLKSKIIENYKEIRQVMIF